MNLAKEPDEHSVFIIILNWNNAPDTIECLSSVRQLAYGNYFTVLIDNGSDDDSLKKILSWAVKNQEVNFHWDKKDKDVILPMKIIEFATEEINNHNCYLSSGCKSLQPHERLIVIKSNQNLGFAKGCNTGIKLAMDNEADYVMLLNNDAVLDRNSVSILVRCLETQRQLSGAAARVNYYNNQQMVNNCGGKLLWYGARKYFYFDSPLKDVPQNGFRQISFINCCAALFRSSLFKNTGLLSEKFFFGEEDFELSWRLKKRNMKLACCFDAVAFHKGSASVNEAFSRNALGKTFIYYLNRYINMRDHMPGLLWSAWRLVYLVYIFYLLRKTFNLPVKTLIYFSKNLMKFSGKLSHVSKETFEKTKDAEQIFSRVLSDSYFTD